MARTYVTIGATYIPDTRSGIPIANGYVYIGNPGTDPTILANRKTVYLIQSDGSTVTILPASQPLRTSGGGVIQYPFPPAAGTPVQVQTDDNYSIVIQDSIGTQVYGFTSLGTPVTNTSQFVAAANFYPNDGTSLSNAYVVISPFNPKPADLVDDQLFFFRPSANNTGASTLSVILAGGPSTPHPYKLPDGINDPPAAYLRTTRDMCCRWDAGLSVFRDIDLGFFVDNPSVMPWNQFVDYYTVPSYVTGSDTKLYKSVSQTGPNFGGAHNPVGDGGVHWTLIVENPIIPPNGSYRNLNTSATGTNANIAITADWIQVTDGTNTTQLSNVSLTINSAVNGANGLDTGVIAASTVYYYFVIYNPTTSTAAGLISLSRTVPTMPAGYTQKAYAGSNSTDGTVNKYPLNMFSFGSRFYYRVNSGSNVTGYPTLVSGNHGLQTDPPTWFNVDLTAAIPKLPTPVMSAIYIIAGSTGSAALAVAATTQYGGVNSTTNPPPVAYSGTQQNGYTLLPLETTSIQYASSGATAYVRLQGWVDDFLT